MTFGPDEELEARQVRSCSDVPGPSREERLAAKHVFNQGVNHARAIS
jgi:hypothetical protein